MAGKATDGFSPARLAALRTRAGKTQQQLADELGISRVQVVRWETGVVTPRASRIHALAGIFGVPTTELMEKSPTTLTVLRTRAGLTQQDLGEQAGLHRQTISGLESGHLELRRPWATQIAQALNVDVRTVWAADRATRKKLATSD